MLCFRLFVLSVAVLFGGIATAQESARVEAEKLLESLNMEATFDAAIAMALDSQLEANPKLVPYKDIMAAFFAKYASYKALKPAMVEIYVSEFSATELRELREFYTTPTGRKAIERLPTLLAKGREMGRDAVQAHMEELQQLVEAETKRLQEESDAAAKIAQDAVDEAAKD
jgi:hypothetical protein